MPQCRDNRKARRKRNDKLLRRLVDKRYKSKCFRDNNGPNPEYHTFIVVSVDTRQKGPRRLIKGFRYRLMPNQKYRELLEQLVRMCSGLAIDLKEVFPDGVPESLLQKME